MGITSFEIKRSVADVSKARKELGFQARTNLRQGLKKMIGYYEDVDENAKDENAKT